MKPLHPSIKTVWILSTLAWQVPVFLVLLLYEGFHWIAGNETFFPRGLLALVAFIVFLFSCTIIPQLLYRSWSYELREDELLLERGIFTRVRTIVPLKRIQHLDVSQNLIEREFDLARLIVHTASSRNGEVELPGLHQDEAERLRLELKQHILAEA